jgi:hypothetical protein
MLKIKVFCVLMLFYCFVESLPLQEQPITPQEAAIIDEIIVKLKQLRTQNDGNARGL